MSRGLARLAALHESLALRVSLLRNRSASVALEVATLAVSEVFEQAIQADVALPTSSIEAMLRYQVETRHASTHGWADTLSLQQIASNLPFEEMASMEAVLHAEVEAADQRLRAHLAGLEGAAIAMQQAEGEPEMVDIRGSFVEVDDGYLYRASNASATRLVEASPASGALTMAPPLFVSGFNSASTLFRQSHSSGEWRLDRDGGRRLRALGTNTIVLFASPASLLLSNLTLSEVGLSKLREELSSAQSEGLAAILHVPSALPEWALQLYPDLGVHNGQHSVSYDIDHPQAEPLMHAFFSALMPSLSPASLESDPLPSAASSRGCHPAVRGVQLANEPALRGTASAHTVAGFGAWLSAEYGGNLAALVANWQSIDGETVFDSFQQAAEAGALTYTHATAEPAAGSGQAARLADWFRFNDGRVTAWQRRLAAMLWQLSPCHATLAKLNEANNIDERLSDHGIDFYALANLHNISAFDSQFGYPGPNGEQAAFKSATTTYRTDGYSSDWLNQLVVLPFMTSAAPGKLLLDTELHTLSAMRWRHAIVDEPTARVVGGRNLISAALGRGGQLTWLWGRNQNGVGLSPSCTPTLNDVGQPSGFVQPDCNKQAAWFALSALQYPRGLHAHATSSLLVQRHARAFALLGRTPPRVWLLHSRHTARLSEGQAHVTIALVEALAFLGVPYGFIDADEPDLAARIVGDVDQGAATADGVSSSGISGGSGSGGSGSGDSGSGGGSGSGARGSFMQAIDWLLLPAVSHVLPSTLAAVAARLSNSTLRGRTLGVVAAPPHDALLSHGIRGGAFADDAASLSHMLTIQASLGRLSITDTPTPTALLRALEARLLPDHVLFDGAAPPLRPVVCVEGEAAPGASTRSASAAFGVFVRARQVDDAPSLIGMSMVRGVPATSGVLALVANLLDRAVHVTPLLTAAPPIIGTPYVYSAGSLTSPGAASVLLTPPRVTVDLLATDGEPMEPNMTLRVGDVRLLWLSSMRLPPPLSHPPPPTSPGVSPPLTKAPPLRPPPPRPPLPLYPPLSPPPRPPPMPAVPPSHAQPTCPPPSSMPSPPPIPPPPSQLPSLSPSTPRPSPPHPCQPLPTTPASPLPWPPTSSASPPLPPLTPAPLSTFATLLSFTNYELEPWQRALAIVCAIGLLAVACAIAAWLFRPVVSRLQGMWHDWRPTPPMRMLMRTAEARRGAHRRSGGGSGRVKMIRFGSGRDLSVTEDSTALAGAALSADDGWELNEAALAAGVRQQLPTASPFPDVAPSPIRPV